MQLFRWFSIFFFLVVASSVNASEFTSATTIESYTFNKASAQSIRNVMLQHGFSKNQVQEIFQSDDLQLNRKVQLAPIYLLLEDSSTGRLELRFYEDSDSNRVYVFWYDDLEYGASEKAMSLGVKPVELSGIVATNLKKSVQHAAGSINLANQFVQAFRKELKNPLSRAMKNRLQFWLAAEGKYDQGFLVGYGKILTASIAFDNALVRKDFAIDGTEKPVGNDAPDASSRPFYLPVDEYRVTSGFQLNRFHPIRRKLQPHLGIDLGMPTGSLVYAPQNAEVLETGFHRARGRYIILQHTNNLQTIYFHLKKIDPAILAGEKIKVGQVLGLVGCSGQCTRHHLHFSVKFGDEFVDPTLFTKSYSYHQKDQFEKLSAEDTLQKIRKTEFFNQLKNMGRGAANPKLFYNTHALFQLIHTAKNNSIKHNNCHSEFNDEKS